MTEYLLLFLIVMGVNLIPAFGPPTWTILVLFTLNSTMPPLPMVLIGATAAALGRYMLALAFRALGSRLSKTRRDNLQAAREMMQQNRARTIGALALFVFSPLPSAQLFEAAGLMRVRLLPFTVAFFGGRVVSYAIYVMTAAEIRERTVGEAFTKALTEPVGIAVQLVFIAMLVALTKVPWSNWLQGR